MNKRFATVLLFALVVSAVASFLLYQALGARFKPQEAIATTEVPVARGPLEIGALIKDVDITTAPWPGGPPPNALLKKEEIVGRGVIAAIYAGEPIRADRLAPIGAGAGLASTIPMGKRAMALRVNDVVGVAGFVTPGQRVDLLILGAAPNGQGTVSKTLLQNIEILSAGQQIQKDAEGKPIPVPVVNILVSPEEAEVVSLASNHTQIQLVLRNPMDKEDVKTTGALFTKLFADMAPLGAPPPPSQPGVRRAPAAPRPPVAEAPKKPEPLPNLVVEILNGGAKAQVTFKQPEAKQRSSS